MSDKGRHGSQQPPRPPSFAKRGASGPYARPRNAGGRGLSTTSEYGYSNDPLAHPNRDPTRQKTPESLSSGVGGPSGHESPGSRKRSSVQGNQGDQGDDKLPKFARLDLGTRSPLHRQSPRLSRAISETPIILDELDKEVTELYTCQNKAGHALHALRLGKEALWSKMVEFAHSVAQKADLVIGIMMELGTMRSISIDKAPEEILDALTKAMKDTKAWDFPGSTAKIKFESLADSSDSWRTGIVDTMLLLKQALQRAGNKINIDGEYEFFMVYRLLVRYRKSPLWKPHRCGLVIQIYNSLLQVTLAFMEAFDRGRKPVYLITPKRAVELKTETEVFLARLSDMKQGIHVFDDQTVKQQWQAFLRTHYDIIAKDLALYKDDLLVSHSRYKSMRSTINGLHDYLDPQQHQQHAYDPNPGLGYPQQHHHQQAYDPNPGPGYPQHLQQQPQYPYQQPGQEQQNAPHMHSYQQPGQEPQNAPHMHSYVLRGGPGRGPGRGNPENAAPSTHPNDLSYHSLPPGGPSSTRHGF